jgi:hypothetical protein
MDTNGISYILNGIWDLASIYTEFMKLLSHPLQRSIESKVDYDLESFMKPSASSQSVSKSSIEISENMDLNKICD